MPIIPLIGLSIIIHIVVILFATLFRVTPVKWQKRVRIRRRPSAAFGKLIIVIIFGLAFVSAAWMVRLSVMERHSTIAFISYQFKHYTPFTGVAEAVKPPPEEVVRMPEGQQWNMPGVMRE